MTDSERRQAAAVARPTALQLRQQRLHARERIPPRGEGVDRVPASFAQWRLWFLHRWAPLSGVYNISFAARLRGELRIDALRHALDGVVERHEVLRTSFLDDGPRLFQVVHPAMPAPFEVVDLLRLPHRHEDAERLLRLEQPGDHARPVEEAQER